MNLKIIHEVISKLCLSSDFYQSIINEIIDAYCSENRKYHNFNHIGLMLELACSHAGRGFQPRPIRLM